MTLVEQYQQHWLQKEAASRQAKVVRDLMQKGVPAAELTSRFGAQAVNEAKSLHFGQGAARELSSALKNNDTNALDRAGALVQKGRAAGSAARTIPGPQPATGSVGTSLRKTDAAAAPRNWGRIAGGAALLGGGALLARRLLRPKSGMQRFTAAMKKNRGKLLAGAGAAGAAGGLAAYLRNRNSK